MKKYLQFLAGTLLMAVIIFEIVVIGILKIPSGVFHSSYQSLIQDKYRILKETNEPKIIVISGSSSAFGLDQAMLEEATGYKVANMGLHAGFGHLFYTELAKSNINEGDIVLLGYEYGWQNGFDFLDQSLIMTGIDDNIEMYSQIPISKWKDFVGYIFKYAELKNSSKVAATGIYSREAFDSETGQMTMARDYNMEYAPELYGYEFLDGEAISDEAVEYLLELKEYVEKRGASIYFIAPPLVIDSVCCDLNEFTKLKETEERLIGIPYISNPLDYLFPEELMSNARYHCNSRGEKVRTQYLIDDMKRANIIK